MFLDPHIGFIGFISWKKHSSTMVAFANKQTSCVTQFVDLLVSYAYCFRC